MVSFLYVSVLVFFSIELSYCKEGLNVTENPFVVVRYRHYQVHVVNVRLLSFCFPFISSLCLL